MMEEQAIKAPQTLFDGVEDLIEFGADYNEAEAEEYEWMEIVPPDEAAEEEKELAQAAAAKDASYVASKQHMSVSTKRIVGNTIAYIVLAIMSVVWILPFVFIFFESFRVESTGTVGYIIPHEWGFDNYINLFKTTEFGQWFLSTFLMGLAVAVFQTIIVLSVSYVLSRTRFKGRKFLMNFMLVLGMFPGFLTMILIYTLLYDMNLAAENAPFGLVLVYVASSGMGYHISKGFFDTIPRSLDEAARVDGATRAQILVKVILPLAKSILIYTILMGFMAPWGDFIFAALMAANRHEGFNVAAGLQWMIDLGKKGDNYTMFCAGGVIVAIPIATLFLILQKYYVAGVTGGAVKG